MSSYFIYLVVVEKLGNTDNPDDNGHKSIINYYSSRAPATALAKSLAKHKFNEDKVYHVIEHKLDHDNGDIVYSWKFGDPKLKK